ncbi:MAG: sigma-70 family RNA polymerase sigma factor [Krumholzibacteria bacterium]|nr:sigma-70 family RNA polymerase sigma factor [Candidatus Krumholzibacteria bacterium]
MAPSTHEALDRYGPLVLHVIWRLVPDRDRAADIYQDTFLAYHRTLAGGDGIAHPQAWLCRTARNGAFRHLDRAKREDLVEGDPAELPGAAVQAPEQGAAVLLGRLRQLVAALPDQQRQAFCMRWFEDLPFAEIADQLGCTPEAARASAHKAALKLRAQLEPLRRHFHV